MLPIVIAVLGAVSYGSRQYSYLFSKKLIKAVTVYYVLCLVLICFEFTLCFSLGRKPQRSTHSLLFHLSYQPNPSDPDPANQDVVLFDVLWTNIQTCHGLGPASILVDTQRCL